MSMVRRILVVDDEAKMRKILSRLLSSHNYEVEIAADGQQCLQKVQSFQPHLILLDLKMPNVGGMEVLAKLDLETSNIKVIVLTAVGTIQSAVQAVRSGAYDFITKPFDTDELLLSIERALEKTTLEEQLHQANQRLGEKFGFENLITNNSQMKDLIRTGAKVAASEISVLITGESGTGKELIANAIHQNSARKEKPFIAINCSALPDSLIESELFGHKKGAFTGADKTKAGIFEMADGGTLFLDEIGEMGSEAQAKILRFTQTGEYTPVGGTKAKKVDVRLIAATNRDLERAIEDGSFRSDLYYRLNVVNLNVPSLRQRNDDIPLLLNHFLQRNQGSDRSFGSEAIQAMMEYQWPGNIRELENVVKSAIVISDSKEIDIDSLPRHISQQANISSEPSDETLKERLERQKEDLEKQQILESLQTNNWKIAKTAQALGLSRTTLFRRMKQYQIKQDQ